MSEIESPCWICGSRDISYVDSIGCPWCSICFERIYLGDDMNRVIEDYR